jgi:hypothetical protein
LIVVSFSLTSIVAKPLSLSILTIFPPLLINFPFSISTISPIIKSYLTSGAGKTSSEADLTLLIINSSTNIFSSLIFFKELLY